MKAEVSVCACPTCTKTDQRGLFVDIAHEVGSGLPRPTSYHLTELQARQLLELLKLHKQKWDNVKNGD